MLLLFLLLLTESILTVLFLLHQHPIVRKIKVSLSLIKRSMKLKWICMDKFVCFCGLILKHFFEQYIFFIKNCIKLGSSYFQLGLTSRLATEFGLSEEFTTAMHYVQSKVSRTANDLLKFSRY